MRNKKLAYAIKKWLSDNRSVLEKTSIPSDIYEDQNRWIHFVMHEGLDYVTDWQSDLFSDNEESNTVKRLIEDYNDNINRPFKN